MPTISLILFLAAPVPLAPLVIFGARHLFAIFVRQSADLFLEREIRKDWAITIGTDIAIINVFIFSLAWWATVGFSTLHLSWVLVSVPFIAGVVIALMVTTLTVKAKLKIDTREAFMVGLLTCAGGNLPLIVLMPALLMLVNSQDMLTVAME